ncbi:MAG: hypothetical protein ABF661_03295, partial [Oenococcus sp.]
SFIYDNPGRLNERLFVSLLILNFFTKNFFRHLLSFCCVISIVLTFRFNAICSLLLFPVLGLFIGSTRNSFLKIIPLTITALLGGENQIRSYFVDGQTPRQLLFQGGMEVARRFFPLGSGFSTFGSDQAAKHYSELYYELGYNNMWGMQPNNELFLNDTFWPMLVAQFGFIGAVLYLLFLITQVQFMLNLRIHKRSKQIVLMVFFYTIISSIGSAILTGAEGMTLWMFIAICINSSAFSNKLSKKDEA